MCSVKVLVFKSSSFWLVLEYLSIWSTIGHFRRSVLTFMTLALEESLFSMDFPLSLTWLLGLSFCQWPYTKPTYVTFLIPITFLLMQMFSLKTSRAIQNKHDQIFFFLLGWFLSNQPIRTALMMSKVRSVKDPHSHLL